ncbi:hypothetical protein Tco_1009323, partial [Tanacetum coccineum]
MKKLMTNLCMVKNMYKTMMKKRMMTKVDAGKTEEVKDDAKKAELPPTSSSLLSTIQPVLLQTTTPIPTPPISTKSLTITIVVPESNALTVVQLRVAKLEKDISNIGDDLQKVLQRHTTNLIQKYSVKPDPEPSKIQTPTIDLEPESEKSALEIRKIKKEKAEKQKMPKYRIKSTDKVALK